MPRFIVTEDRAIWVREFYEVEAASAEEAIEAYSSGESEYLGHELRDGIDYLERDSFAIEEAKPNTFPCIDHPSEYAQQEWAGA